MESSKKNKKQFQCQECDLTFYHRKGLNIHRKIHESTVIVDGPPGTLNEDSQSAIPVQQLEESTGKTSGKRSCKKHFCDQCEASFAKKYNLTRHKEGRCKPSFGEASSSSSAMVVDEGGSSLLEQRVLQPTSEECDKELLDDSRPSNSMLINDLMTRYSTSGNVRRKGRKAFISAESFNQLTRKPQPVGKWNDLTEDCIYKMEKLYGRDQRVVVDLTSYDGVTTPIVLPEFVIKKLLLLNERNVTLYARPSGEDRVDIVTMKKHVCKNCKRELTSSRSLQRHLKNNCTVRERKSSSDS